MLPQIEPGQIHKKPVIEVTLGVKKKEKITQRALPDVFRKGENYLNTKFGQPTKKHLTQFDRQGEFVLSGPNGFKKMTLRNNPPTTIQRIQPGKPARDSRERNCPPAFYVYQCKGLDGNVVGFGQ